MYLFLFWLIITPSQIRYSSKMKLINYPSCLLGLTTAIFVVKYGHADDRMPCLGACEGKKEKKECKFSMKLNLHAGELGYYTIKECGDEANPTIGIEKDVTYIFSQEDETNYYHPLGLAYYSDGAHDDVDELEPGIAPPGSSSNCADGNLCPAPMYIRSGEYLGVYSNNDKISPVNGDEDFGLDVYEPEFFANVIDWKSAGIYEIALKFDVDDFTQDIFYFCHIHQFMTGRIKFVNSDGVKLEAEDLPEIPYSYDEPSEYDKSCGTFGLDKFQLPHPECPKRFVCDAPDMSTSAGKLADCIDSMNCAMTAGMTTNVHMDSSIALFIHQMIPHHQNAVNMCKSIMVSGDIDCEDMTDEDDSACVMRALCYEIINVQNFQIQTMKGVLDGEGYDETDDCTVKVDMPKKKKNKKPKKKPKKKKTNNLVK